MLVGKRRRIVRNHLFRALGDAPRTIDRGVGAGIRISATGSNLGYAMGVSEPAVQAELERSLRPGMVFYDVGANVGFLTLIAARLVGDQGQVVAFEPLSANVDCGTQAFLDLEADPDAPEVLVSTLDGAIDELGLRPPDVVKVDVEGAEVDVVLGMSETLQMAAPRLLIEIHDEHEDPWRERAIRGALEPPGYRLERIEGESGGMPHLLAVPPTS